jgi:hypothetical protein
MMMIVDIDGCIENVHKMLLVDKLALATPAEAEIEVEPSLMIKIILFLLAKLLLMPSFMAAVRVATINNVDARKKVW